MKSGLGVLEYFDQVFLFFSGVIVFVMAFFE